MSSRYDPTNVEDDTLTACSFGFGDAECHKNDGLCMLLLGCTYRYLPAHALPWLLAL
jgi:hypothetical protein